MLPLIPYCVHFAVSNFFNDNFDRNGVGMGSKLMGMGHGNFCGDGVEMGMMSTTVSLFGWCKAINYGVRSQTGLHSHVLIHTHI